MFALASQWPVIQSMALPRLQREDKGCELIERERCQHMPYLLTGQQVMMAITRLLR